jgi:large subunit ribosomal protein L6e
LQTLPSGLLLVTGPHKINGVPLKRVNPAYAIATSTHVDLHGVNSTSVNDQYFAKVVAKGKRTEGSFKHGERQVIINEILS